ncbi:MAG: type IX secretion system membrane protein PorP/SprF [Algoriphagus sp.]|uniref:PorP/SprF family type IX secretion system membrane protein n=1 Tax=Algoriphagus sp. TaxID=1872435 RepID=UPI002609A22D|nr:type IX secretion system membrane protein PorP/SprF [Algoriphagus sp.]MDG1277407.1 type IX secretion system membrane protein PorP/SprF [Algoriphagus sp.]
MLRIVFLIVFSFIVTLSLGQDVQYSQFYANPLYLNPAFSGATGLTRVGANFRTQWPALDQSFIAYSAYLDHFSEKYNSGIGILISGAKESFTQSQNYELGLVYSYKLRLGETSYLHAGTQASFVSRNALFDDVILGTQLDINRGTIIGEPGEGFEGEASQSAFDLGSGLLFYNEKIWLGISAFHLLTPQISYLIVEGNQLPIKYSAHGGIRFDLAPGDINDFFNNTNQERSIAFAFNYKSQGQFSQLDFGAELFFEPLVLGFWYRGLPTKYSLPNNESIIGLLGISLESGVEIGYSYDFTVSKFGQRSTGGAHEVSFRYVFSSKDPRKKYYAPLPSFRY